MKCLIENKHHVARIRGRSEHKFTEGLENVVYSSIG